MNGSLTPAEAAQQVSRRITNVLRNVPSISHDAAVELAAFEYGLTFTQAQDCLTLYPVKS